MSLEVACGRKPLEGNKLSVFRVPVTSCVLVSNIASKMTRDTVRYYFENERKSGGDDDAEIMEYNGFSCVIRFPSPQGWYNLDYLCITSYFVKMLWNHF